MRRMQQRDERGFAAGGEMVVLGVIVTLSMLGLISTAWTTLDRHMTIDAAAHEYMRAYTSAITHHHGHEHGVTAARRVTQERGVQPDQLNIIEPNPARFGPCASATVEMQLTTPVIDFPFFSHLGVREVSVTQHGLIDPHRTSFPGSEYDPLATICADY